MEIGTHYKSGLPSLPLFLIFHSGLAECHWFKFPLGHESALWSLQVLVPLGSVSLWSGDDDLCLSSSARCKSEDRCLEHVAAVVTPFPVTCCYRGEVCEGFSLGEDWNTTLPQAPPRAGTRRHWVPTATRTWCNGILFRRIYNIFAVAIQKIYSLLMKNFKYMKKLRLVQWSSCVSHHLDSAVVITWS